MSHRVRQREPKREAPNASATVSRKRDLNQQNNESSWSVSATSQSAIEQHDVRRAPSQKTIPSSSSSQRPSAIPRSTSGGLPPRTNRIATSQSTGARYEPEKGVAAYGRTTSEDVPLIFDQYTQHQMSTTMQYSSTRTKPVTSGLDMYDDTILGVAIPYKSKTQRAPILPPQLIPELQALVAQPRKSPRPTAPSVSTVSSPSTRFTESPAPWSASTATTTPVSWPSSSPAIVSTYPLKSKTVPQPTTVRTRLPKLPALQPDSSSRSVATSQATEAPPDDSRGRERRKKGIGNSPAPTPPPRSSSVKRGASRSGNRSAAGSIDETLTAAVLPDSQAFALLEPSPLAKRNPQEIHQIGESIHGATSRTHDDLQQSIKAAPPRPTRHGTTDLGESRPMVVNTHAAGFAPRHRRLLAAAFDEPIQRPATSSGASQAESTTTKIERSPSRLGKFSRLGLFSRKGTPSSDADRTPNKLQRRGPAAGTGHEGYGKYARRPRKQSGESSRDQSESEKSISSSRRTTESRRPRKDSGSTRLNRSSSDLEEFVAPRLRPVVMRGGSQTSGLPDSNMSDQPSYHTTPEIDSSRGWSPSPASEDQRSFGARSPLREPKAFSPPKQSPGPQLALRRSQRFGPATESHRLPTPIRTDDLHAPTYINSYDTSQSSVVPSSLAPSSEALDAYELERPTTALSEKEKKARRRWWNPFRRPQPVPISQPMRYTPSELEPELAVSITAGPLPRSVPYYAMIESESENTTADRMSAYLAEAALHSSESPSPPPILSPTTEAITKRESVLLPAAPMRVPGAASSKQGSPDLSTQQGKQPRLAHVGRIPKVVNRNERQHKPSRRSFSQPFARKLAQDEEALMHGALEPERPQLEIHTDVLPSRPFMESEMLSAKPDSAPARTTFEQVQQRDVYPMESTMAASGRSSALSASSVSAGVISIMGPSLIPSALESSMRPLRNPSMLTAEEEIWQEYDDFIDHVMSPSKSPNTQRELLRMIPKPLTLGSTPRPTSRGRVAIHEPRRAVLDLPLPPPGLLPPSLGSPSLDKTFADEVRLRRSRIVSALHSSLDPVSPFSMREFLKDYTATGRDSLGISERLSGSTAGYGPTTPTTAGFVKKQSPPEQDHQENAALLDVVERAKNPAKQSEMHYASLEVARWLSFGRVLFSPAHEEIQRIPDRKILVIDGLGNEDWSIYCAVSYEAQKGLVYDLKETFSYGPPANSREVHNLLPNHRRVETANLGERFPFHSSFFSVVVLRFPPAMSEAKMKNITSECRRILAPGGHLEIMLLDFDFGNMGVQTRRALRELKMRMAIKDPQVNLKPAIDNFQAILGGRGFGGLNRCIVGVPVAGRPIGSTDSSTSSRSSGGSLQPRQMSGDSGRVTGGRAHNFSLNDLVADHSENADAKIGRVVSRTARSWWQHCFEAAVLPDGDVSKSIFADKRVMQECKSRASSFKLLIAYAQKPVFETKRRTMSESGVGGPTTATAGARRGMRSPTT